MPSTANAQLRETPAQSEDQADQALAALHQRVFSLWQRYPDKGLNPRFNDFGLPYQAFEPLRLPGSRPTLARLAAYGLEAWLPEQATALDIGCNHGYLLLGLAHRLKAGVGLDVSESCVAIGNAVAKHLGHAQIQLLATRFADWRSDETFDLVIATDVYPWLQGAKEDLGERLFARCKPGGVVLFESVGIRDPHQPESGFEDSATAVASAGFTRLHQGQLCDDGLSQRHFWLLQRPLQAKAASPRRSRGEPMLMLEGEAARLEPLQQISALLAKHGAWFHPQLRVQAEGGNLSLHGEPGAARASYLRVPLALMPHVECFDISLQDEAFHCRPNGKPMLAQHQAMMEAIMALYNATHKVALWRQSLPFLAWQGEPALQKLIALRPHDQRFPLYQRLAAAGDDETLLVRSFMGSRRFNLRQEHLQALELRGVQERRSVLLPMIDLLNHDLDAEGFFTPTDGGEPVMRTFHRPAADSGELVVRYNLYDAVDTLLGYGFVDLASYWIASVPLTLEVGQHKIEVKSNKAAIEGALPADLLDLRHYLPMVATQHRDLTRLTKLMLCTKQPFSLRRVLTDLVYQLGLAHTQLVAQQQVSALEQQVIEQNRAWWQAFSQDVAHLPPDHPAQQLSRHSLGLIEEVALQLGG